MRVRAKATKYKVNDKWWLKYVIASAALAVISLVIAWWQGAFVATSKKHLFSALSDAFAAPGISAIVVGLFVVVKSSNFFDTFVSWLQKFFALFKQDRVDRKYRNFHKYNKSMHEKTPTRWFFSITGVLFTAISLALLGAYYWVA